MKIVCFTGHRDITWEERQILSPKLMREIEKAARQGADTFRSGGARGVDTLAAIAVLQYKKEHPNIRLELFLTCPDQPARWPIEDQRLYQKILRRADRVQYIASEYFDGIYQLRDQALVKGADLCISYLRSSKGGTAYTCACAMREGVDWINLAES